MVAGSWAATNSIEIFENEICFLSTEKEIGNVLDSVIAASICRLQVDFRFHTHSLSSDDEWQVFTQNWVTVIPLIRWCCVALRAASGHMFM